MLQNWLKPIKGHNGPVPALNVITEPGRIRVNKTRPQIRPAGL